MNIFDLHADILFDFSNKNKLGIKENIFKKYHLKKFKDGKVIGGIFVAWLDDKIPKEKEEEEMIFMINSSIYELNNNLDIFNILKNSNDIKNISSNKINIILGIEGLRAIKTNLNMLELFYNLGFRHASLTWNEENFLGTGAKGNKDRGLTSLGKKLILKMNELGMIIDVSHANEKTFWDIYNTSSSPIIASHSNVKTLCNSQRNLTDEQIKAIAKSGGLIGINAYKHFIKESCDHVYMSDLFKHLKYLIDLVGIDHVAFGFDFCEFLDENHFDKTPINLENTSKCQNFINFLYDQGLSKENVEKIACKNFIIFLENFFKVKK